MKFTRVLACAVVTFAVFVFVETTWSANFGEAPDIYTKQSGTLLQRGLGHVCLVLPNISSPLPCNPAFMGLAARPAFSTSLFLGNEFAAVRDIESVINGPYDRALIDEIFSRDRPIQMEAILDATYTHKNIGVSVTPARLSYFSYLRNQGYPSARIQAMSEREVRIMGGSFLDFLSHGEAIPAMPGGGVVATGMQLRYKERQFIDEDVALFEALTGQENLIQKKDQRLLLLEPSVAYQWRKVRAKPGVNVTLENVGWSDRQYTEVSRDPIYNVGGFAAPELPIGQLDVGLNYRLYSKENRGFEPLRAGTAYTYGLITGAFAVDTRSWSAGVLTSLWSARVGIMYNTEKFDAPNGDSIRTQTTYTELSLVF